MIASASVTDCMVIDALVSALVLGLLYTLEQVCLRNQIASVRNFWVAEESLHSAYQLCNTATYLKSVCRSLDLLVFSAQKNPNIVSVVEAGILATAFQQVRYGAKSEC